MSRVVKSIAFEIADILAIKDWAEQHEVRMVIRLDHGLEDEDYEEVIAIHNDAGSCLLLMWRDRSGITIQPLPGRRLRVASVNQALLRLAVRPNVIAG
ncbi:MAG: hypothetical protein U1E70_20530 [Acetobacteraceae bacterium]|nr:hypothetical protein [Pseudomonadota bacterium]